MALAIGFNPPAQASVKEPSRKKKSAIELAANAADALHRHLEKPLNKEALDADLKKNPPNPDDPNWSPTPLQTRNKLEELHLQVDIAGNSLVSLFKQGSEQSEFNTDIVKALKTITERIMELETVLEKMTAPIDKSEEN